MNDEDDLPKSKSQLKREMHEVQALGKTLTDLPDKVLSKAPLSAELLREIHQVRRIKNHEGRRRQLQYLGKVMRDVDTTEIKAFIDDLDAGNRRRTVAHHELENLRDTLITEGDAALNQVLTRFPAADLQHLRQLIRSARKEQQLNKPPAAGRKLFKYLRELEEEKLEEEN